MSCVLGLDIGSNSIGWSLINDEANSIIGMGVRIFPEGVSEINTDKEESRNAQRRLARQMRVQYERRRKRKQKLKGILQELGMMPLENEDLKKFYKQNPYKLRKKALDSELTLHELGRALYHLNQRRGFKSNRKTSSEEESSGTIFNGTTDKPGINILHQVLNSGKYRTIGEYFSSLNTHELRIRERYTERSMFIDEFEKIWEAQQKFYPELLNDDNKKMIGEKTIFHQRPLKSQKHLVGKCQFFSNKPRAPKSHPLFQRFRMLQQLNMLTIQNDDRYEEDEQLLRMDERVILLEYLSEVPALDLEKKKKEICKLLSLNAKKEHKFNLTKLQGLRTEKDIHNALGSAYAEMDDNTKDHVYRTLLFAEDAQWLKDYAQKKWGISTEQADKLSKVRLEPGYGSLSMKAIRLILPYLEQGHQYHKAMEMAGLNHSVPTTISDGSAPFLEPFNAKDVRNPIVSRAMAQVRKVVNALIREYGKPDVIRVELARELKQPRSKRANTDKENRARERDHSEIKQKLLNELRFDAKREDIIRFKLWREAGEHCPYTGESISLQRLFGGDVDVEHILPYNRTLDDSQMNKTICVRSENARKGNRTPFEAYAGTTQYDEIKERVKKFPRQKMLRFQMNEQRFKEFVGDDFIARQLNDTRYISRVAISYLNTICPTVTVGNGKLTADLRNMWGFNSLLRPKEKIDMSTGEITEIKNRDDHRHHAIDALVVACTTRSMLQRRSTWESTEESERRLGQKPRFPYPWQGIREQAQFALSNIIVSHVVNKRVRGQLHQDTYYGMPSSMQVLQSNAGEPFVVVRKPVRSLSAKEINNILDPVVKRMVVERYADFGYDILNDKVSISDAKLNAIFAEPLRMPTKDGKLGPIIRSARYKKNSTTIKPIRKGTAWVETGSNHHAVLYRTTDAKGNEKQDADVVTLFEAVRRLGAGVPVIQRSLGQGKEFLFSLQKSELLILDYHPDELDLNDVSSYHTFANKVYRVSIIPQEKRITMGKHTFALSYAATNANAKELLPIMFKRAFPNTLQAFKVRVSPIGKLERDES